MLNPRAWACAVMMVAGVLASPALAQTDLPVVSLSPIEGTWKTAQDAEITIALCPDLQSWCGSLSKIVIPSEGLTPEEYAAAQQMAVETMTDQRNKDPALRSRPMLGLQMLTLRQGKEPHIFDGEIYNPQDGNIYSGYVELLGPNNVRLNGCVMWNVLCRGEDWVRVIPEPVDGVAPAN